MPQSSPVRVRVAGPPGEARRLSARLSRAGIPAAPDDGAARCEVLVALGSGDLAPLRVRTQRLIAVGLPSAPRFASGADDVVAAGEPEMLFRRVRAAIERADLEERSRRLQARLRALEEGLAEVAHDLRSPLHAALGHAELLAKDGKLAAGQRKSAEAVVRQAERALQLAERVLEGAGRLDQPTLQVRSFQLQHLLEVAVSGAQQAARTKGVRVSGVPLPRAVALRGDPDLLARLLDNLLANAVRHTPQGGEVTLTAERASPRTVRLEVRDTGAGISPKELPRLLSGLGGGRGLRICRDIAERHGGDLWAESTPGQGSRFVVDLPLDVPSSRPQVLLVSDREEWVRDVRRALEKACEVRHSPTSRARLPSEQTDLVLVEVPAKGKVPALARLRAAAREAQVPVIDLPSVMGAAELARALFRLTG